MGGNVQGGAAAGGASAGPTSMQSKIAPMLGQMGAGMMQQGAGGGQLEALARLGPPPAIPMAPAQSPTSGLAGGNPYQEFLGKIMGRPSFGGGGKSYSPSVGGALAGRY